MTPASEALRDVAIERLTTGAGAAALLAAGVGAEDSRAPGEGGVTTAPDGAAPLPYVEVQGVTEAELPRAS